MTRRSAVALVIAALVMFGTGASVMGAPSTIYFVDGTKFLTAMNTDEQDYYLMGIIDALGTSLSSGVNDARACLQQEYGRSGISVSEVRDIVDRHTTMADYRQYTMSSIVISALSDECQ